MPDFRINGRALAADKPVLLSLREMRASLIEEIAAMESSREEFRLVAIRSQRERAIGTTFPNFELASGRNLEGVTVASRSTSFVPSSKDPSTQSNTLTNP